jgi:apolipoprotein N-acyltransferase
VTSSLTEGSRPVFGWSLLGSLIVWLAQPPLAWWPLAWVALVPWGMLITGSTPLRRRGWLTLWLSGAVYWMLTMQGVRLAHPALYPGWVVLGMYLGAFPVAFVALGRVMHHRWRAPLWIVVPVVWTGLECVRSYAFTGFSAALLGHSQANLPWMIQITDLGGTYGVTFVLAAVSGTVLVAILQQRSNSSQYKTPNEPSPGSLVFGAVFASVLVAATLAYGKYRVEQSNELALASPLLNILVIQRNEPLVFTLDPNREQEIFDNYIEESLAAIRSLPDADLMVWPESMFTGGVPWRELGESWTVPPGFEMTPTEFEQAIRSQQSYFLARCSELNRLFATTINKSQAPDMLVGCSVYRYGKTAQAFGGAIHIDHQANLRDWYGKRHLVMFGEYIPFGDRFPWLYSLSPLSQGATPGDKSISMSIGDVKVAPSICFETMVEQVTGNSLRNLSAEGIAPDVILNLTNDAWFHGSAILDHHSRCSQFVAVANRRPLIMAANQGPTVWFDGCGRKTDALAYLTDGFLVARPTRDNRWSLYQTLGDAIYWPLALVTAVLAIHGTLTLKKRR